MKGKSLRENNANMKLVPQETYCPDLDSDNWSKGPHAPINNFKSLQYIKSYFMDMSYAYTYISDRFQRSLFLIIL